MQERDYAEESFPGQIRLLYGLASQVRTLARRGTFEELLELIGEFDREERQAWEALPWAPVRGALYLVKTGREAPERFARVIADGVWRERQYSAAGCGSTRAFYSRSELRHEDDETGPAPLAKTGRLVLETGGGGPMSPADQVNALRTFPIPEIPRTSRTARRALNDVAASGRTAGLVLTVRHCANLHELPNEAYECPPGAGRTSGGLLVRNGQPDAQVTPVTPPATPSSQSVLDRGTPDRIPQPLVPKIGQTYAVKGTRGVRARIVDDRIWQKQIGRRFGAARFALTPLLDDSKTPRGMAGSFMFGRLVLRTTGGTSATTRNEIRSLLAFEIPALPVDNTDDAIFEAFRVLQVVEKEAAARGLTLTVRQAKYLEEIPGEYTT